MVTDFGEYGTLLNLINIYRARHEQVPEVRTAQKNKKGGWAHGRPPVHAFPES